MSDFNNLSPLRDPTPGHRWEVDPHKGHYDCERDDLVLGEYTDDELANYAFNHYDRPLDVARILAQDPGYHSPIARMTGVKDRIRWLTRQLDKKDGELAQLRADAEQLRNLL